MSNEIQTARLSAIQLLSGAIREAIEALPVEVLQMSEIELNETGKITQTDWFLRKKLWNLIENAQKSHETTITTASIYDGVTSHQNFFQQILHSPVRLAWLLIKPTAYEELIDEATYFGIQKLRNEVLTMPVTEKSAPTILKAIEFLTNRALGPVVQRIEAKHAHLNLQARPSTPDVSAMSPEELNERLSKLKRQLMADPTI